MNSQAFERGQHSTATGLVYVDTCDGTEPMLLEMARNAPPGLPGLSDVNATATVPKHVDVVSRAEVLVEPLIEGGALLVDAPPLSTLAVPAPSFANTQVEFAASEFLCQSIRCELLKLSDRVSNVTSA